MGEIFHQGNAGLHTAAYPVEVITAQLIGTIFFRLSRFTMVVINFCAYIAPGCPEQEEVDLVPKKSKCNSPPSRSSSVIPSQDILLFGRT